MLTKCSNLTHMCHHGHLSIFSGMILRHFVTFVKHLTDHSNLNSNSWQWLKLKEGHPQSTVMNVCRAWTEILEKNDIPEPRVSVEYIVAHAFGRKTMYNVSGVQRLTQQQVDNVNTMCRLRLQHQPLQYIVGEWDFGDIELKLRPPVFIPRPETEELVELAVHAIEERPAPCRLLELGCGSGAITLSLLKKFPTLCAVAVDVSTDACQLTEENALQLGVTDRMTVLEGDVTDSAVQERLRGLGRFNLLVSNPPYIPTDQMTSLEPQILKYEDHGALHGGVDGLDVVRHILHLCPLVLHPHSDVLLEIQPGQPRMIQDIVNNMKMSQLWYVASHLDFAGRERFCHLRTGDFMESENEQ